MTLRVFAGAALALSLSACATVTGGTAPQPMAPEVAARSHVGVVRMTSDWVQANHEFTDTFTEEVLDAMRECASGPERLDLNIHVSRVRREDRVLALLNGGGEHEIAGVAEFVHPQTRAVVGRYPIRLAVDAGGPVEIVLADRQLMVSDAFATELCRRAFGA